MVRGSIRALVAVLALGTGNAAAARSLVTAVHEPQVSFLGSEHSLFFDRIVQTGSTATRIWLEWEEVGPTMPANPGDPNDPAYLWAVPDRDVSAARARGLRVLLTIYEAPAWAERAAGGRQGSNNPDPAALGQFARAAASRYFGQVFDWEVWNEPNLGFYFTPQYDGAGRSLAPNLYRALVNAVAEAVRGVDPRNRVAAGATAPFGHAGVDHAPLDFMRKVLCMTRRNKPTTSCPARTSLDAWSHHPYTEGGPNTSALGPGNVSIGDLREMRRLLLAARRAGRIASSRVPALWVTEFSWDTKGPDSRGVPHRRHARWTAEALYRMHQAGVTLVTWWLLRDRPWPSNLHQSGFYFCGQPGLDDESTCWASSAGGDAVKRSHTAFRFPFVALRRPSGVFVWGRTPFGEPARVRVERLTPRGWRRVARLRANRHGIFARTLRISARRGYLRARLPNGERSLPFSLRRPPERRLNGLVFGCGGGVPC
jgi:hypothetical protein